MEGKAEKNFKNLGKKIDEMIEELADLKNKMKAKYGDRWEEVNRSKDTLENEFNQFKEKHKDRFEEAERSMEKAGYEIKKAFEAIFSKRSKTEPEDKETTPPEEKASEH